MSIVYWIIFGLIAGGIANFIAPSSSGGIVGSIILGIIGAIVGGYLGQRFFGVGVTGFNLMSFVVAVAGSLVVLFISRLLMRG
ncbi:MAG: GlsB/YeaQ/YmgE family stress response membrane protein [bacterium]|nr:GlsB/YeaQ/YmgE family stress response membrane protein [bacterium]